jgi:hypothetical protein
VQAPGPNQRPANITLEDIATQNNLTPQGANRTDSLSLIPTYNEESNTTKKLDKKSKSKDDGSRKPSSGWGWFGSGNSEEKEREKREKEEKDLAKKNKTKLQKAVDKNQYHDATRLDLLQTSIEGSKGRESTVFDRVAVQMEDEQPGKKRPGTSEGKKTGFLSSVFGSSRRKSDREEKPSKSKSSHSNRGLSPDVQGLLKPLRPDVDYNWTRFSILQERAIYRMAHIKLANPRRELHSQVLLSNFMYSYLAKVQQMHPQIQIPASAAQKQQARQEKASKQREEEERRQAQAAQQQQQQQQQQMLMQQQQQQQQAQSQQRNMGEEYGAYQQYHHQDVSTAST